MAFMATMPRTGQATSELLNYVAIAAFALIGFERLNVLPSSGSFVQIYYLLAAPFVINLLRGARGIGFAKFYAPFLLLLALSLVSNNLYDAYHWKKLFLVGYVTLATFALADYVASRVETHDFARSLKLFIALNIAVTSVQLVLFYAYHGPHISGEVDAHRFLNFDAVVIGDYFRASGFSFDSNKGTFDFAYALVMLTLLADRDWAWFKYLYPLTFFVHSRSVLLSMLPAQLGKSWRYAAAAAVLYVVVLLFLTPHAVVADRASQNIACHLSSVCGSNATRWGLLLLWGHAMEQSTWVQIVFGHGLASSGQYLEQILGTQYGDFANGYLNIVFELGLAGAGLLVAVFVKLWCTLDSRARVMLLLPLLLFQLTYSNLAEPLVIFALSYFYLRSAAHDLGRKAVAQGNEKCA